MKTITRLLALAVLLSLVGCEMFGPKKPVYLNRDIKTVAVLPPFTEVVKEGAWETMWPMVLEGVASRGYNVIPAQVVQAFYDKNNFKADPGEIRAYSAKELATSFKVDAIFYSNITRWGYQYAALYATFGVEGQFEMVDGKTEERLFWGEGSATTSKSASGGGTDRFVGSLVGVAKHAFVNDEKPYAHQCVEKGLAKLPLPGFEPKPAPKEGESAEKAEEKEKEKE